MWHEVMQSPMGTVQAMAYDGGWGLLQQHRGFYEYDESTRVRWMVPSRAHTRVFDT